MNINVKDDDNIINEFSNNKIDNKKDININDDDNKINSNNNDNKSSNTIIDKCCKEKIQRKIKANIYLKKPFKEKKRLGRKIKAEENLGEHNKFSDDNILRKIKNAVLNYVFDFINEKIKSLNSKQFKYSISHNLLFKLKQNYKVSSKVEYNKEFLKKTLKAIFSQDISSKYSNHSISHNKDVIDNLLKDKDKEKKEYFTGLFNLNFLDALNHFRGTNHNEILNGLKNFDDYCLELNEKSFDEEYKKILKFFVMNYEKEILNKKTRKKRVGKKTDG